MSIRNLRADRDKETQSNATPAPASSAPSQAQRLEDDLESALSLAENDFDQYQPQFQRQQQYYQEPRSQYQRQNTYRQQPQYQQQYQPQHDWQQQYKQWAQSQNSYQPQFSQPQYRPQQPQYAHVSASSRSPEYASHADFARQNSQHVQSRGGTPAQYSNPSQRLKARVLPPESYTPPAYYQSAPSYSAHSSSSYGLRGGSSHPSAQRSGQYYFNPRLNIGQEAELARFYESKAYTVSAFINEVNAIFQQEGSFYVKGEISSLSNRLHLYYSIKDEQSSLNCVMFASRRSRLPFEPRIGQKVVIYGKKSIYAKNGSFSFIAESMILAGAGWLMERLQLLERNLEAEGVFARHLPLPRIIQRVAVVTSLDGRARYDLSFNALRRNPMLELAFIETKVQGPDAPESIVSALQYVYNHAAAWDLDVIVLTRGGGSFEDLLCFSHESVVRTVANSPVPIISAIGHDKDHPLCDRAADVRVSTPTAAAEAITPITREALRVAIYQRMERSDNAIFTSIEQRQSYLDYLSETLLHSKLHQNLANIEGYLNHVDFALEQWMQSRLQQAQNRIQLLENRILQHGLIERLNHYEQRLQRAEYLLGQVEQRLFYMQERLERYVHYFLTTDPLQGRLEQRVMRLAYAEQRLNDVIEQRLEWSRNRLQRTAWDLMRIDLAPTLLQSRLDFILACEKRLNWRIEEMHARIYNRLSNMERDLDFEPQQDENGEWQVSELPLYFNVITKHAHERLNLLSRDLLHLNPLYQLSRGLSLTTTDGEHSVQGKDLSIGSELITILQDATVHSTVTKIEPPADIITASLEEDDL